MSSLARGAKSAAETVTLLSARSRGGGIRGGRANLLPACRLLLEAAHSIGRQTANGPHYCDAGCGPCGLTEGHSKRPGATRSGAPVIET